MNKSVQLIENYFKECKKIPFRKQNAELAKPLAKNLSITKFSMDETAEEQLLALNKFIFSKLSTINSTSDSNEIVAAVDLINELLKHDIFATEETFSKCQNYLKQVMFTPNQELTFYEKICNVYGQLLKMKKFNIISLVDYDVDRIQIWLGANSSEGMRISAVLMLNQIAINAPTLFNIHIIKLLRPIWVALRDCRLEVRNKAIICQREMLKMIAKRDVKQRIFWCEFIYNECMIVGFQKDTPEYIHSAISVLSVLFEECQDFTLPRYAEICRKILHFRNHKDKIVSRTVVKVIPQFAKYKPTEFREKFLELFLDFLYSICQIDRYKDIAFLAIGSTICNSKEYEKIKLEKLVSLILGGIKNEIKNPNNDCIDNILKCIDILVNCLKTRLDPYANKIIEHIFMIKLSEKSSETLFIMSQQVPSVKESINGFFSFKIVQTLTGNLEEIKNLDLKTKRSFQIRNILKKYSEDTSFTNSRKKYLSLNLSKQSKLNSNSGTNEKNQVILILKILRKIAKKGYRFSLTQLKIAPYMDSDDKIVRREAALSCTDMIRLECQKQKMSQVVKLKISELVERLVTIGITDTDEKVRCTIFKAFTPEFDQFLVEEDFLKTIFIAVNDIDMKMRILAIELIGRLMTKNPTVIAPALRKLLIKFTSNIRLGNSQSNRSDSTILVAYLIRSVPQITRDYTNYIFKILEPNIKNNDKFASSAMFALGELALITHGGFKKYEKILVPQIIKIIKNANSFIPRDVCVKTLEKIFSASKNVISPYSEYPGLLKSLMTCLKPENSIYIREETCRLIGFLGAWDPAYYLEIQSEQKNNKEEIDLFPTELWTSQRFSSVAIQSLIKILMDPDLGDSHDLVIESLMYIVQNIQDESLLFLPKIVQIVLEILFRKLNIVKTTDIIKNNEPDESLSRALFHSLIFFIPIAKTHVQSYFKDIFKLIKMFWEIASEELFLLLIILVEEISKSLNDSFKLYLDEIVPLMLKTIFYDKSEDNKITLYVLHGFRVLAKDLKDFLFLIIPEILRLCKTDKSKDVKHSAIRTLCSICEKLDVSSYSSQIFHCLVKMIDQKDNELLQLIINTVCHVIFNLESYTSTMFISVFNKVFAEKDITHDNYTLLTTKYLKNQYFNYRLYLEDVKEKKIDEIDRILHPKCKDTENFIMNQQSLKNAWNTTERATKEDWLEWINLLSSQIVKENPSSAIRHCYKVVIKFPTLARELFNNAFTACWIDLEDNLKEDFVFNLENAFKSSKIPAETIHILLNLVEFMERCDLHLPIRIKTLAWLSEKIQSYAKALHYKELHFKTSPVNTFESIISIYNMLNQPESADGMLDYAINLKIEVKESWYEKLRRWESALEMYEKLAFQDPKSHTAIVGRLNCLKETGRFKTIENIAGKMWADPVKNKALLDEISPIAACAAWNLQKWKSMELYVGNFDEENEGDTECSFFKAVIAVHKNQFKEAEKYISFTRQSVAADLTALVGESYSRSYNAMVQLQKLVELEEVMAFKKSDLLKDSNKKKENIKEIWRKRLKGVKRGVDIWRQLLSVRSLVLTPEANKETLLTYSSLCRRKGLLSLSFDVIKSLLKQKNIHNPDAEMFKNSKQSDVKYSFIKHLWDAGLKKESLSGIESLIQCIGDENSVLKSNCYLRFAQWQKAVIKEKFNDPKMKLVLNALEKSTKLNQNSYKAYHSLALMHYKISICKENGGESPIVNLVPALRMFFKSIALGSQTRKRYTRFQDALRILAIMFKYGDENNIYSELKPLLEETEPGIWLDVTPQIIARIKSREGKLQELIRILLLKITKHNPQALIYPLTVAMKSSDNERKRAAGMILDKMKEQEKTLVEQALLVSKELIRVAILWPEIILTMLKDASKYYLEKNTDDLVQTLKNINEFVANNKPETHVEKEFMQAFEIELNNARIKLSRYLKQKFKMHLEEAWAIYSNIFKQIVNLVNKVQMIDLSIISPVLDKLNSLELFVPGKYQLQGEPILITSFCQKVSVIKSKRKPRKIVIIGSDGNEYTFLLKGHEDLRQDERVMQLFGLINTLFEQNRETKKRGLNIRRYTVVPLSPTIGLIEWVPNCDTFFSLVKNHRLSTHKALALENEILLGVTRAFKTAPLLHKIHAFATVYSRAPANDLRDILWLKSGSSEEWFERRTTYTTSLAVMSMVGYVLGLGDRHPSNLMLDRTSGKVLHIDFGDCFEVAMRRKIFPERVPFRLTRTMVAAMGLSGVDGLFRSTCETVMRMLRFHRESLLAALEAFVYDPLLNWRLIAHVEHSGDEMRDLRELGEIWETGENEENEGQDGFDEFSLAPSTIKNRFKNLSPIDNTDLIDKSVNAMKRISDKLSGKDFGRTALSEKQQVRQLIREATSIKNLCQAYEGWCPFW